MSWRLMAEFDPSKPALVHDALNDQVMRLEALPAELRTARPSGFNLGMTEWDGLLLDGWKERPSSAEDMA